MVADEVGARRRDQRGEATQEFGGLQQHHLAAVAEGALEPVGETAVGQFGEPLLRKRRPGAVAAEVRESLAIIRVQMHRRMKGEAREVGSALLGAPSIWRCSALGVQCLRLCGAECIQRPRIAVCRRKPRAQQRLETRNDAAEHRHHGVVAGRR